MREESLNHAIQNENESPMPCWTFLSNHALVMMCLVDDPTVRMRDVAIRVGITERAVQRILTELEDAKYLKRHREGRRNFYVVDLNQPMRHPMTRNSRVSDLLRLRLRSNDHEASGQENHEDPRQVRMSHAANGTSYGRRRGPVPRQIQPTEIPTEPRQALSETNGEAKLVEKKVKVAIKTKRKNLALDQQNKASLNP